MNRTAKTITTTLFAAGALLLAGIATACGGSDKPTTAGAPEARQEKPAATPTTATRAGKASGNAKTNGPASDLGFSGSITAKTDDVGSCGMQFGFKAILSVPVGDDLMFFQLIVPRYNGPASYGGDLTLTDGAGTSWGTDARHKATVLVNEDGHSGTVDGNLFNKAQGTEVRVTGTWRCEA
jgi:hypothetical protein